MKQIPMSGARGAMVAPAGPVTVVGLSYRTAPLEIREQVAFSREALVPGLRVLAKTTGGGVILSTCHRTEVYGLGSPDSFIATLFRLGPLGDERLRPYLFRHSGEAAVRHLCAVAAGLDSLILGEPQIMGQVRQSFRDAQKAGAVGGIISALFHRALRAGRRVRRETGLGRPFSLAHAALLLAREHLTTLRSALVVGTGEMGELATKLLAHLSGVQLMVLSHTPARAAALAARYQAEAIGFDHLAEAVRKADLIIACSSTPSMLIMPAHLEGAALGRRPQVYVDLSVPRCIDPTVGNLPRVRLFNVDELRTSGEDGRPEDVSRAWTIVEEETQAFLAWMRGRTAAPAIKGLRDRAGFIRQRELQRGLRRLDHLSERDRHLIDRLTITLVNKILHEPTVRLKENAVRGNGDLLDAMRRLFGLDESPSE